MYKYFAKRKVNLITKILYLNLLFRYLQSLVGFIVLCKIVHPSIIRQKGSCFSRKIAYSISSKISDEPVVLGAHFD